VKILEALHKEEANLSRQLGAIRNAIAALNSHSQPATSSSRGRSPKRTIFRRTMSAAVRAKISRKAKAGWAKIRAQQRKARSAK
jgi:hypothetical protein